MAIEMEPNGNFGHLLYDALIKREMSVQDFAEKVEIAYETARKLIKGLGLPSNYMATILADKLKLDIEKVEEAVMKDRVQRQYGKTINRVMPNRPSHVQEFDPILERLTPANRELAKNMLRQLERSQKA